MLEGINTEWDEYIVDEEGIKEVRYMQTDKICDQQEPSRLTWDSETFASESPVLKVIQ